MTFLQSPVSLGRGPSRDSLEDSSRESIVSPEEHEVGSGLDGDAPPDAVAAEPIPLRLFGFAALSGAAAAALVGLTLSVYPLRPNNDPRLDQLIHDNSELRGRVATLTDKVRLLETEGVATSQASDALGGTLKTTTGEVDTIKATLAALVAEQQRGKDLLAGVSAPTLFGVAVVQLRDRVDAGLAYDWELVNLRGIAGSDPALLAALGSLAPMSSTGLITQERLLAMMQVLIAREGSGESLMQAGLGVVSRVLGPNLVNPPAGDPLVLSRSLARLTAGDLTNFLREMQGLSVPAASAARPLVEAARQRLVALQAVQELLRSARAGLQSQLRSLAETAGPSGVVTR